MTLLSRLGKILRIHDDEGPVVFFLFANSFLAGLVLAFYYPPAISLFLSQFDSGDLPPAFILQAVLAYGVALLFRKLKTRTSIDKVQIFNVAFMFASIGLFSIGALVSGSKFFAFIIFTWFNVLIYLTSVQLAEPAQMLFDIRQVKRLYGLVSSGGAISGILASFSFPLLLQFIELKYFTLLCAGVLAIWLLILIPSMRRFRHRFAESSGSGGTAPKTATQPLGYFSNRYTTLVFILALLPPFGLLYVDFIFLGMTREWFEPERMASFLGIFYGFVKIAEFILKAFFTGNLITRLGLRTSLLTLPVLLLVSLGCAALVGMLGEKSIFLFALVILSKLFERVVRPGVNEPAAQILFQPIPPESRSLFQARIEALPKQLGIGLVGAVLVVFSAIEAIQEVQMIWIFLLILPGWLVLINMLYGEYRNALQQTLLEESGKQEQSMLSPIELLKERISTSTHTSITRSIKLLEKIDPAAVPSFVIELLGSPRSSMRLAALWEVERLQLVMASETIDSLLQIEEHTEVRQRAEETRRALKIMAADMRTEERMAALAASADTSERRYAAMLLGQIDAQQAHPLLIDLLQDSDTGVLRAALVAAGLSKRAELWPFMIEQLASPVLCNAAASALIQVGSDVLPELETWFDKSVRQPRIQQYIVLIYGRVGGQEARQLLWDKFNFPDDRIERQVLVSLNLCQFQAGLAEEPALSRKIEECVENTAWSMASLVDMGRSEQAGRLVAALSQEIDRNRQRLFLLLSLLYDPQLVEPVRDRLVHKTESKQGVVFALELMDVFIAEDLKEMVLPILDDITLTQSLKRLEARFPHPRMTPLERTRNIINREYTKVSRWTKTWALYLTPAVAEGDVPDELVANLFNPDPVLRETAAQSIYRIDPDVYDVKIQKLPQNDRPVLPQNTPHDAGLAPPSGDLQLTIDKVNFLKTIDFLVDMPELALARVVTKLEVIEAEAGETFVDQDSTEDLVYILVQGQVRRRDAIGKVDDVAQPAIVSGLEVLISEPSSVAISAVEKSRLFYLNGREFFEIIFEHIEWAGSFLLRLNECLQAGEEERAVEWKSVGE
jgi:ATP:ADP antiporter, AAA family